MHDCTTTTPRHPGLDPGSIFLIAKAGFAGRWMLKQVQHDEAAIEGGFWVKIYVLYLTLALVLAPTTAFGAGKCLLSHDDFVQLAASKSKIENQRQVDGLTPHLKELLCITRAFVKTIHENNDQPLSEVPPDYSPYYLSGTENHLVGRLVDDFIINHVLKR